MALGRRGLLGGGGCRGGVEREFLVGETVFEGYSQPWFDEAYFAECPGKKTCVEGCVNVNQCPYFCRGSFPSYITSIDKEEAKIPYLNPREIIHLADFVVKV